MELDEKLFHFLWKTKRHLSKKKHSESAVFMDKHKDRLATLACAFFEKTIFLKESSSTGGVSGASLFLPKMVDIFDDKKDNFDVYLFRIVTDSFLNSCVTLLKTKDIPEQDYSLLALLLYPALMNELTEKYSIVEKVNTQYSQLISSSKKNKFFEAWESAIFNINSLENASIPKDQKKMIHLLISNSSLAESTLLDTYFDVKEFQNELKLENSYEIKSPLISRPAINPITLSLKKSKKSKKSKTAEVETLEEVTVKKTKSKEKVTDAQVDEDDPDCNPASLLMEGVQTADIFSGGKKMLDGSDELDDHFDAIEDLEINQLTKSSTQAKSVFKADISINTDYEDEEYLDDAATVYQYDEWNFKKKKYNKNWCSLYESPLRAKNDIRDFVTYKDEILKKNSKEVQRLKQNIEQIMLMKRPKNRQRDGSEFDLDSLITAKSDILSGHTPDSNLYISKRQALSDLGVLILIDSSLSSDSWVQGRRVLDVAKESVIVVQEVLENIFSKVMVASFYSNTRKNCIFNIIKSFDEPWKTSAPRLEEVRATGYTRIGVSLRHSVEQLNKIKSKNKVILLLSDGKPTDYDAYEGKRGIADVRQAVREASAQGVNIYSLAIDKDSKFYFPQLFGPNNYEVLKSPQALPEQLIKLFGQMI